MHAISALKTAKMMESYVDSDLYINAMRLISNAASKARTRVSFTVDADLRAQDVLGKRLRDDGYRVDWATSSSPRTEDGGVIVISWKEAK